jgi:hypothetical protein
MGQSELPAAFIKPDCKGTSLGECILVTEAGQTKLPCHEVKHGRGDPGGFEGADASLSLKSDADFVFDVGLKGPLNQTLELVRGEYGDGCHVTHVLYGFYG